MNFYEAWHWLINHPYYYTPEIKDEDGKEYFSMFQRSLDITVVKVDPETNRMEDDETLNTKTVVWLETGNFIMDDGFGEMQLTPCHDYRLDCGDGTFEEAIIELAKLVQQYIGLYNTDGSNKNWKANEWTEKTKFT